MKFYHGGAPGLAVGDFIIPRRDHPEWRDKAIEYGGLSAQTFGDLGTTVSVTTDADVAQAYAGEYLNHDGTRIPGAVYEVRPVKRLEIDPDFRLSFPTIARCGGGAIVIAVHEAVPVSWNERVISKALAAHRFYASNDQPFYDVWGYIRYTPSLQARGYTRDDLIRLGPWMPLRQVERGIPIDKMDIPPLL